MEAFRIEPFISIYDFSIEASISIYNNQSFRTAAITFLSTLAIRRDGEHFIANFARAASTVPIHFLNEYLKEENLVDNDNLVYSSEIAVMSYCYSPSYALIGSAVSFVSSYIGFEYLTRNEVDYSQLSDNVLKIGIGGSSYIALSKLGIHNTTIKLSISLPIFAITYASDNLDGASYNLLNRIMPLDETASTYELFQKFNDKNELNHDMGRLAYITLVSCIATGTIHNLLLNKGSKLAKYLYIMRAEINFEEFIILSIDYMLFSLVPSAIHKISINTLRTKEIDGTAKNYSLKFLSYVENNGLLTLRDSDLSIIQFNEKIIKSVNTINIFFDSLSNSLPNLSLVFIIANNHPKPTFLGLGSLSILSYSMSVINDFLSDNIIRLKKDLDLLASKKVKITEHDVTHGVKIKQDEQVSQMTHNIWINIFEEQNNIQSELNSFECINRKFKYHSHHYVYSLDRTAAQIIVGFLANKGFVLPEEALVYSTALNQLLTISSFRLTERSELDELSSDIQILLNFISKIEQNSMIPMNIIQIAENQYVPLYVNTLLFTRGDESNETNIKMEDVKFEKGHIYAVTGGNGSGKSSFFEILTLQGNNPNILGFSRCEGEIQTSSKNLTLVSQNPYCPLYITPFQWIVKMETSKLSQLSEEENDKLRYKILNYSKKLKLFNEGDDNNLENILDIQQDNWYRTISGGEKIKVELIRQVFLDEKCPEILLLDEIFGPLDSAIKTVVMDEIAEHCSDSTILIIYHNEKECVDTGFFTDNLHFADGEATLRDMC